MNQENYDVLVIGGGSVGDPISRALANAGKKTALIEKDALGGTCANRGCTPTKAYEASARIAHMMRVGARWGIHAENIQVHLAGIRARKNQVIAETQSASEKEISETPNLTLLRGEATFTGPKNVSVRRGNEQQQLIAETIIVCTGSHPSLPPLQGLDNVPFHTSDTIYETDEMPRSLLTLGGNYIGVEAAQIFQRFGCPTTIIEAAPHLLPQEDGEVAQTIQDILERDGLTVRTGSKAAGVRTTDTGEIEIRLENGATLLASHLLIATGRTPNTKSLHLDAAGVATDAKGNIAADDCLRTSASGIWTGGDVAGSPQFTHIAYDDFRVLRSQLLGDGSRTRAGRAVPYIVYTDPPLGRVGLSEQQAQRAGRAISTAFLPMTEVAYASDVGETDGFIKVVLDAQTEQILGVTVLGLHAEEVMSTLQVAMMGNLTFAPLRDAIFAYPTVADSFTRLFSSIR